MLDKFLEGVIGVANLVVYPGVLVALFVGAASLAVIAFRVLVGGGC